MNTDSGIGHCIDDGPEIDSDPIKIDDVTVNGGGSDRDRPMDGWMDRWMNVRTTATACTWMHSVSSGRMHEPCTDEHCLALNIGQQ